MGGESAAVSGGPVWVSEGLYIERNRGGGEEVSPNFIMIFPYYICKIWCVDGWKMG